MFFAARGTQIIRHINEFFSDKLNTKLCKQLSEHDFDGTFVYVGFNEPLLHKKFMSTLERQDFF